MIPERNGDATPADQHGDAYEGPREQAKPPAYTLPILSCGALLRTYPERRPAVIEGLLREGETMNVIAPPKVGKSFLVAGLAFDVATGQPWLSTFRTTQGNVLIVDNELHPETISHRLRMLAEKRGISHEQIAETVSIASLRGRLLDLYRMGEGLRKIPHGRYKLVIVDAFYRTMPMGTDENDNATMASLYNLLDSYADQLGAAFVLIHHATKGNQSAKAITDVGAGAGAQSRATDTHLVLRPHEESDVVVLDAATRSWKAPEPLCLRWDFPVWTPAADLDPTALRKERPRRPKPEGQDEPKKTPEPPMTAERFAEAFGKPEPHDQYAILEAATLAGLKDSKAKDLLKKAIGCGFLFSWKASGANSKTLVSTVRPPEPPGPPAPERPPEETSPGKKRPPKRRKKKPI
jgi:hypothetical protein